MSAELALARVEAARARIAQAEADERLVSEHAEKERQKAERISTEGQQARQVFDARAPELEAAYNALVGAALAYVEAAETVAVLRPAVEEAAAKLRRSGLIGKEDLVPYKLGHRMSFDNSIRNLITEFRTYVKSDL